MLTLAFRLSWSRVSISWLYPCDKSSYIRFVYSQYHVSFCLKTIRPWHNLSTGGHGHVICMLDGATIVWQNTMAMLLFDITISSAHHDDLEVDYTIPSAANMLFEVLRIHIYITIHQFMNMINDTSGIRSFLWAQHDYMFVIYLSQAQLICCFLDPPVHWPLKKRIFFFFFK